MLADSHSLEGAFKNNISRASGVDQYSCYVDALDRQLNDKEVIPRFGLVSHCSILERDDVASKRVQHIVPLSFDDFLS